MVVHADGKAIDYVGIDAKTGRYLAVDPSDHETRCGATGDTGAAARLIHPAIVLSGDSRKHIPSKRYKSRRVGRETMSRVVVITGGGARDWRRLCTTDGGGGRDGCSLPPPSCPLQALAEETGAVALGGRCRQRRCRVAGGLICCRMILERAGHI